MVSVLSQVLDITERTKTEAALRYKLSELDAIYTHTPMMMCLVDSDRRILYANPAFRVIQGFSEEELVGGHACGVFGCVNAKDDPQGCGYGTQCRDCTLLKAIEDTFQTGTGHSNEEHFITVNYKENQRNFTFLGSTVLIYSGEQRHLLLSLLDISELKKAEEQKLELEKQLFQAQKLESLGVLAGGIAHDFNNILAIIVGNCFLAKMYPDAAENNLSTIEKASERAAELCRQMLAYAGKNQFIEEHVNFGGLVDEMITMLKATISQNIVINFFCTDDIPLLKADSSQLRQIVMNLIINAVEAIGDAHGEILITLTKTAVKSRKEDKDHLGKTIPAGSYICLKVTDDGCGMDEENTRRIFEPFYSTKFTGRGLGMSAVLGIITAHKGALQLVSQPGLGTTFKIFLPVESIYLAGSDYPEHPSSLEEAQ
ncbi:MAG: ATP-binding protein, partial [Desulfuromonadales bacterium]